MRPKGWVKLHRRILDWEHAGDPHAFAMFVRLILSASWVDGGTVSASVRGLAKASGLTVQEVRTVLQKLERSGEIRAAHAKGRKEVFSIVNFAKYQPTQFATQFATQRGGGKTHDSSRENDERAEERHRERHRERHTLSLYEEE